jgi:glycine cleavage system transcriptional repressor
VEPDVHITVYGTDRSGIVAQVTGALAEAGLNIIDLETAVGGSEASPIYIMSIEGNATRGIDVLQAAVDGLQDDIEINLVPVDTMRG